MYGQGGKTNKADCETIISAVLALAELNGLICDNCPVCMPKPGEYVDCYNDTHAENCPLGMADQWARKNKPEMFGS